MGERAPLKIQEREEFLERAAKGNEEKGTLLGEQLLLRKTSIYHKGVDLSFSLKSSGLHLLTKVIALPFFLEK